MILIMGEIYFKANFKLSEQFLGNSRSVLGKNSNDYSVVIDAAVWGILPKNSNDFGEKFIVAAVCIGEKF